MKVVINKCFGGFGLSEAAYKHIGIPWDGYGYAYDEDNKRSAPELVECVEALGESASGNFADLVVIEIPDGIDFYISEYDGIETIHERHASWG